MSVNLRTGNDRHDDRTRRAGYLVWRIPGNDRQQTGWLLETSQKGAAFAWRGETLPPRNTLIETREDGDLKMKTWRNAIVRHSRVVHDNLCVIGVEHYSFNATC
ncbi:MAG: hypothetical protein AABZ08_12510 [Planctomycetota bacterium]